MAAAEAVSFDEGGGRRLLPERWVLVLVLGVGDERETGWRRQGVVTTQQQGEAWTL